MLEENLSENSILFYLLFVYIFSPKNVFVEHGSGIIKIFQFSIKSEKSMGLGKFSSQ